MEEERGGMGEQMSLAQFLEHEFIQENGVGGNSTTKYM